MKKEVLRKKTVIGFIIFGLLLFVYDLKTVSVKEIEGVGLGFNDDLTVKLIIEIKGDQKKILDMVVTHVDTEDIVNPAITQIKENILKKQTFEVDTVAGATYTSEGIREGVKEALKKLDK